MNRNPESKRADIYNKITDRQRGGRRSRCLAPAAAAGPTPETGSIGTLPPGGSQHAKRPPRRDGLKRCGGASPAVMVSVESGHLCLSGLAIDGLSGIFDRTIEGLPALTDDVLVGGDGTFGGHMMGENKLRFGSAILDCSRQSLWSSQLQLI